MFSKQDRPNMQKQHCDELQTHSSIFQRGLKQGIQLQETEQR